MRCILVCICITHTHTHTHTHTLKYYSTVKKDEIMSFAATWMDLETITLEEVRERQIWYHSHVESHFSNAIDEPSYKSETDSQTSKTNLRLQKGKHGGRSHKLGAWDKDTLLYIKIDNQHEPAAEHRELYSALCNNLCGRRTWKRMNVCITESLVYLKLTL